MRAANSNQADRRRTSLTRPGTRHALTESPSDRARSRGTGADKSIDLANVALDRHLTSLSRRFACPRPAVGDLGGTPSPLHEDSTGRTPPAGEIDRFTLALPAAAWRVEQGRFHGGSSLRLLTTQHQRERTKTVQARQNSYQVIVGLVRGHALYSISGAIQFWSSSVAHALGICHHFPTAWRSDKQIQQIAAGLV